MDFDVKDVKAADSGRDRVEWAERRMPVLRKVRELAQLSMASHSSRVREAGGIGW